MHKFRRSLMADEIIEGTDLRTQWEVHAPIDKRTYFALGDILICLGWMTWCVIGDGRQLLEASLSTAVVFWISNTIAAICLLLAFNRIGKAMEITREYKRQAALLNNWLAQGSYDHISVDHGVLQLEMQTFPLDRLQITAVHGELDPDSIPSLTVYGVARDSHQTEDRRGNRHSHHVVAVDFLIGSQEAGWGVAEAMAFVGNEAVGTRLQRGFGDAAGGQLLRALNEKARDLSPV
ncbi:hypothetical protein ACUB14_001567 [Pseudomonas aeruginosa]|jgi:hypothetical protein|uniref:Transmembrane protein n=4 Tax=Pseudomonas TaxID=286 RepID=A0ABD7JTZ1_PSEAI|nr:MULTISPECIES: hypothetical protein [Pseudomonas]AVK09187.1 hypothetical protein CSB93_6743 [Pseudomonas paraeruginosa]AWE95957.1 hypothetical protein CSC28_6696 [Pseudomonas paraeruginosa]EKD1543824.1 hypothetical protein [Pseudomonas aeruginosa]EKV8096484.1 hypothetical protein [Pseudomonas aeruginosa]EKW6729886.1 hypothetical protein [Pseudomonas aeruginosa]